MWVWGVRAPSAVHDDPGMLTQLRHLPLARRGSTDWLAGRCLAAPGAPCSRPSSSPRRPPPRSPWDRVQARGCARVQRGRGPGSAPRIASERCSAGSEPSPARPRSTTPPPDPACRRDPCRRSPPIPMSLRDGGDGGGRVAVGQEEFPRRLQDRLLDLARPSPATRIMAAGPRQWPRPAAARPRSHHRCRAPPAPG
jgi:hypothetical protein